jgi:hypothetical protein
LLTGNFNLAKLCGLIVGRSDDLYSVIGTKIQKHLTYKNFNRWALYNYTIKGKSSREKPLRAYFLSKNKLSITDDLEAIAALVDRAFLKSLMIPKIFGAGKISIITNLLSPFMEVVNFSEFWLSGSSLSKNFVYSEFFYHIFTKVLEEVTGIETWQHFLQEVHDFFFEKLPQGGSGFSVFNEVSPVFSALLPDNSVVS